jgi:hypothetical protein
VRVLRDQIGEDFDLPLTGDRALDEDVLDRVADVAIAAP